jgi:hypothetical protein
MMIWVAWCMLALESLVIALSLWMMWVMVSEASRAPTDPFSPVEHPPEPPVTQSLEHPPEAKDEPALFTLEEVDERGYVSSRKLHMGCEAAVCRTQTVCASPEEGLGRRGLRWQGTEKVARRAGRLGA